MTVIINGTAGITFPDGTTQTDGLVTPVPAADGGTGLSSPGTAGNVLTSNGTAWVSAIAGGGLTNNVRQAVTSSATTTIDVDDGNVVDLTMAANITTLAFSNVPASGTPLQLVIVFRNAADGTAYNVTWPASIYWNSTTGAPGTLIGPTLTGGANTITVISLLTTDGGTKWRGWVEADIPGQDAGNFLYTWGSNSQGQLGLGDSGVNRSSPVQVGFLTNWAQVSMGDDHTLAIKADGTMWSWGLNNNGQLGLNDTARRSSPVQVGSDTNWALIANIQGVFSLAIRTTGSLWAWGRNNDGQLGQNDIINRSSPVQIGAQTDWASVIGANDFSIAIKTTGTMWSWGNNSQGQLGQNIATTIARSSPVQIGSDANWSKISGASDVGIAIRTTGSLWAWGDNSQGQLGQGNVTKRSSPVQIGAQTDWALAEMGNQFCVATKTTGTMWSWGANNYGRLGQNVSPAVSVSSPVQIGALTDWSKITTGSGHALATKTTGTMWSWGLNNVGQLGINAIGAASYRSSPVQIGADTNWAQVNAGNFHSGALATAATINPA